MMRKYEKKGSMTYPFIRIMIILILTIIDAYIEYIDSVHDAQRLIYSYSSTNGMVRE